MYNIALQIITGHNNFLMQLQQDQNTSMLRQNIKVCKVMWSYDSLTTGDGYVL